MCSRASLVYLMDLVLVVRRQRAAYKNLCGSLFRFCILNFFLIISHTFDEIDNHRPIYLRQRQNRESESGYFRRHLTVTWAVVVCLHFGVNCAVLLWVLLLFVTVAEYLSSSVV